MRVKLLTFHSAVNYGAVIQAHALAKALEKRGAKVEVINYCPEGHSTKKLRVGWTIQKMLFNRFVKEYLPPLTPLVHTNAELLKHVPDADAYIVGSDQVWNPDFATGDDFTYFLDFVPAGKKKFSYAASFGREEIIYSEATGKKVAELLRGFDAISVREASGVEICRNMGLNVNQVLDPTFLIPEEQYKKTFGLRKANDSKKGTLLCYKLVKDEGFYETSKFLADNLKLNATVIGLPKLKKGLGFSIYPSPRKWIELFFQASCVFTDSFHGVAISIIFRKNFIVVPANIKRFTRIKNLLGLFSLEDRICWNYEDVKNNLSKWRIPIDYSKANPIIEEEIKKSNSFIDKYILKKEKVPVAG